MLLRLKLAGLHYRLEMYQVKQAGSSYKQGIFKQIAMEKYTDIK